MTPADQNALHSVTLSVGGITIEGFSRSGVATWLLIPEFGVMFDAGECPLAAVPYEHVFLTHVHGDHSRCLLRHWQLRQMFNLKPATYYVPESSLVGFCHIVNAEASMEGVIATEYPNFEFLDNYERTPLKKGVWVEAFPVTHRVPSQGFTVGRTVQKLKPKYAHLEGAAIGALRKAGTVVTDSVETPVVTFIGDCVGASLKDERHIWTSKVVIIECTYIEDEDVEAAAERGHTHLNEIIDLLRSLDAPECDAVVLKHFSLKCSPNRIRELVASRVPASWASRVHLLLP